MSSYFLNKIDLTKPVKAWITDEGEINCLSQKCSEDCPRYNNCWNIRGELEELYFKDLLLDLRDAERILSEVMGKLENISFVVKEMLKVLGPLHKEGRSERVEMHMTLKNIRGLITEKCLMDYLECLAEKCKRKDCGIRKAVGEIDKALCNGGKQQC